MARMIGRSCDYPCGKKCCRFDIGKGKAVMRLRKKSKKSGEKRQWKREIAA